VVELGSGIGSLKTHLPAALCTDLFPNPWLDLACDAYALPFASGAVSHLVLFDVFHHLEAPAAFLREARRALAPGGRVLIFEPYVSLTSYGVYGALHPEPVAWREPICLGENSPRSSRYYAAQGNATRLFFCRAPVWPPGWQVFHREAFASFTYLLSGGFSRPALYPAQWREQLLWIDRTLSRWPRLFGARCLVGLQPVSR
jgi:SAM-dependent methyltransferase